MNNPFRSKPVNPPPPQTPPPPRDDLSAYYQKRLNDTTFKENVPKPPSDDKTISFVEKMLKVELLFSVLIVLTLVFLVFAIFVFRLDLVNYVQNPKKAQNPQPSPAPVALQPRIVTVQVDNRSPAPIFISQQGVDIEKAFKAPPNNIKVTVNGQLKKEVFGFLPYWALYKTDEIDTRLLTSISYFGLEVDGDGNIIRQDSNNRVIEPWFYFQTDKKLTTFFDKMKKDRIKTYVTLKCFNQANIVQLTTKPSSRTNFISNALYLLSSHSLDGINVDFEYIGTPEAAVRDGFSILMTDLNKELKRQHPDSLLTIDTFVDAASANRIHDPAVLAQNSDGLVIMGYDFHTPGSSQAGSIAPIEGSGLSIKGLMGSYLEKAPSNKLIFAVGYYGYDWPVDKATANATVIGSSSDVKIYPYGEIIDATKNSQIQWDEFSQTPWYSYVDPATKNTRVVHFEDTRSLGIKYDFINSKAMAGVGIWALGFDGQRTELLQLLSDKFAR